MRKGFDSSAFISGFPCGKVVKFKEIFDLINVVLFYGSLNFLYGYKYKESFLLKIEKYNIQSVCMKLHPKRFIDLVRSPKPKCGSFPVLLDPIRLFAIGGK